MSFKKERFCCIQTSLAWEITKLYIFLLNGIAKDGYIKNKTGACLGLKSSFILTLLLK